jgi:glutamate dehydrogenase (NADP+)
MMCEHSGVNRDVSLEYMYKLHDRVAATAEDFNVPGDLHSGVNITGFMAVASAMFRQGAV